MNQPQLSFFRQKQHAFNNMLHTWLLVGGSIGLLAVCAWVFFGPVGIIFAAVFGGVSLYMASRISPRLVLQMYKAQKVSRAQFPQGHAILDTLVERAALETRPELYVVPSKLMNAFAVGRRRDAAVAMTDRLIRSLTVRELAGVMAHEVTHIKNEDIRVMAIADMVSRFTSAMSTFGMITLLMNLPAVLFGAGAAVPWTVVLILMFAPTIGGLLQLALSRTREYDADLGAAMLTGDPDGLASALIKLEKQQKRPWEGIVLPGGRVPDPSLLRTHPRTEDRVARLMALKEGPQTVRELALGKRTSSEVIPETVRRELPQRASPVPKIRRRWGRKESERYADYASLMKTDAVQRLHPGLCGDDPACEETLTETTNNPKIHITRGGVWY